MKKLMHRQGHYLERDIIFVRELCVDIEEAERGWSSSERWDEWVIIVTAAERSQSLHETPVVLVVVVSWRCSCSRNSSNSMMNDRWWRGDQLWPSRRERIYWKLDNNDHHDDGWDWDDGVPVPGRMSIRGRRRRRRSPSPSPWSSSSSRQRQFAA